MNDKVKFYKLTHTMSLDRGRVYNESYIDILILYQYYDPISWYLVNARRQQNFNP